MEHFEFTTRPGYIEADETRALFIAETKARIARVRATAAQEKATADINLAMVAEVESILGLG